MKRRGRSVAGFTLLELLVAMTVLGILTALLASGLSFGTRVWEREQGQLDQWAELQSAQDVIRRTVLQSLPLSAPSTDGTEAVAFVGTNNSIDFLGPPAAQSIVGGIYQYRLLIRTGARGPRLVLTWRLRSPDSTQRKDKLRSRPVVRHGETDDSNQVVLMDRITLAEFSYFGAVDQDTQPRWRDSWQDASKLPLLVRVRVTFPPDDRRKWPELVIAPAITGQIGASSTSQGGGGSGGGGGGAL
jgi:general secretion pathway protein J